MNTELHPALPDAPLDGYHKAMPTIRGMRLRQWIELVSSVILALATVATAWCGYQSARWGGEQSRFVTEAATANIKAAKFNNLAEQRLSLHVGCGGNGRSL